MARYPELFAAFAWALSACGGRSFDEGDLEPMGSRAGAVESFPGFVAVPGNQPGAVGSDGACGAGNRILSSDVSNARDIGGIALEGGGTVACGAVFRGGPLQKLSSRGCAEFAARGVRTVVDLRTPSEREDTGPVACVLAQSKVLFAPMPVPYNVSPQDYLADLNATESVAMVFHKLADDAAYPLYFHCAIGRDRTGVVAAVILLALGATRKDVVDEYMLSRAAGVGAYPDSLAAVLDDIEQRGGVEAYLGRAGVSAQELAHLRTRMIVD
jgi:protein-tyrosine phosphatase